MTHERCIQIWNIADEVHKLAKIDGPPYNPEDLVRKLGGTIQKFDEYGIGKLGYRYGFCCELKVDESSTTNTTPFKLIVSKGARPEHLRFEMATQLGDLILHRLTKTGSIESLESVERKYRASERELESREFAASFLVPRSEFEDICGESYEKNSGKVNIVDIAKRFGVSTSVITVWGAKQALW